MKSGWIRLGAAAAALAAVGAFGYLEAASARRPSLHIENGTLINKGAGYYFAVPEGWLLDAASKSDRVKLVHSESGAQYHVGYWYRTGTTGISYLALQMSLESPDMHWRSMGKGSMALGGRDAMCYRGSRVNEGRAVKEFHWLAEVDEYVYYLSATVDLDKFEARAEEIDRMYASFTWGVPPKAP